MAFAPVVLAVLWYALGLVGAGFFVAHCDEENRRFSLWSDADRARFHRQNIAFGVFIALWGPVTTVVGFLLTGFGQDGWWSFCQPARKE